MFAHERTRTTMKSSYFAQVCMSGTFLLSLSHFPSKNVHFLSVTNTNRPIFISQTILRINSFFLKCCYPCSSPPPKISIRLLFFFATVTQDEEINSGCKAQCRVSGDFTSLRNRTPRKSEHTCMLWTACHLLRCLFFYNKKCCIHFTAHCKFMKASYVENLKFFHFKNTDIATWIIFIVLYLPGGGWLGLRNVLIFQPRACL